MNSDQDSNRIESERAAKGQPRCGWLDRWSVVGPSGIVVVFHENCFTAFQVGRCLVVVVVVVVGV